MCLFMTTNWYTVTLTETADFFPNLQLLHIANIFIDFKHRTPWLSEEHDGLSTLGSWVCHQLAERFFLYFCHYYYSANSTLLSLLRFSYFVSPL